MVSERLPGMVKIGYTNNLKGRLATANTGCPFNSFEYFRHWRVPNTKYAEDIVKELLSMAGYAKRKEWYECSPTHLAKYITHINFEVSNDNA